MKNFLIVCFVVASLQTQAQTLLDSLDVSMSSVKLQPRTPLRIEYHYLGSSRAPADSFITSVVIIDSIGIGCIMPLAAPVISLVQCNDELEIHLSHPGFYYTYSISKITDSMCTITMAAGAFKESGVPGSWAMGQDYCSYRLYGIQTFSSLYRALMVLKDEGNEYRVSHGCQPL